MAQSTHIFLIRHGQTDWNIGRQVMGKLPVPLNEVGRQQAAATGKVLRDVPIRTIYHSPHLRTLETAQTISANTIAITPHEALCEVSYGEWEGKPFSALTTHEAFTAYFADPATCRIPGGESMGDVQTRAVAFIESLRAVHAGEAVALVSHSDVIKAVLVHYLELPLKALHRLCIDNGSISILQLSPPIDRVLTINRTPDLSTLLARRTG